MSFTYEVGMRVRERGKALSGEVTDVDSHEVRVRWDNESQHGHYWIQTSDIMPDTPEAEQQLTELTAQIQTKIDEATSALEIAFKAWREAAELQAGREGAEAYYLRGNDNLDLSKFEDVIEQNGWSTSSLYC